MSQSKAAPEGAQTLSLVSLLLGMSSVQLGASVAKHLFPALGPAGTVVIRLVFGSVLLNLVWRPWRFRFSRAVLRDIGLYGLALGCMNFTLYQAIARIPLGVAVALEFLGPLAVSLLASRRAVDFVWAALAALGVCMISPLGGHGTELDPVGCGYALLAAVGWAFYIVFGQRAGSHMQAGVATCLGMTVATVLVTPVALLFGVNDRLLDPALWPQGVAVALMSGVVPYTLEMVALRRLRPQTFGILMSLEPAMGALVGWLVLAEVLAPVQWLSIVCVIAASLGSTLTSQPQHLAFDS